MKTIVINGMEVELVKHAVGPARAGQHRQEAGLDEDGRVFFKGVSGKWSLAHHTVKMAMALLAKTK